MLHVILPKLNVAPRVTDSGGLLWRAFNRGDRFRRDTATPSGDCGPADAASYRHPSPLLWKDDATPFQVCANDSPFHLPYKGHAAQSGNSVPEVIALDSKGDC
jgi:hypothetical protein